MWYIGCCFECELCPGIHWAGSSQVDDACSHPNWSMGRKITVDSATLMNKGLEVIEAHYLYGTDYNNIEIVVHPQSIIHSMVETADSSVLGQVCTQTETSNNKPGDSRGVTNARAMRCDNT